MKKPNSEQRNTAVKQIKMLEGQVTELAEKNVNLALQKEELRQSVMRQAAEARSLREQVRELEQQAASLREHVSNLNKCVEDSERKLNRTRMALKAALLAP